MGTTAYLFWMAERQSHLSEIDSRQFDAFAKAAERTLFDLRAAQHGLVAEGQEEDFWVSRAATLVGDFRSQVSALKREATSPSSALAFDNALSTLQDLEQMGMRAREYTRTHQPQLASNLIFADGMDLARTIADAIDRGRVLEIGARDEARAASGRREMFSLGAAAAAATLIVLLLLPTGRRAAQGEPVLAIAPAPMPTPPRMIVEETPLSLDGIDGLDAEDGWTRAQPRPAEATSGHTPSASPPPVPEPVSELPAVDLLSVAAVCNDLARVVDTRALPALLERAASLLDGSGIVLWIADPDGRELAPIVTYGYPASVVTRLGTIQRDAENVTAAAFRTSLLQTVKGDADSNGAIAAPLVTPGGCVGVMAAEVRHEAEQRDTVLAVAAIVAAQLAALVGPPSTRAKAEVAG